MAGGTPALLTRSFAGRELGGVHRFCLLQILKQHRPRRRAGSQPLAAGFFTAGEILVEQVVHRAGGSVFEVGVADDCSACVEQAFGIDGDAGRDFDLN